MQREAADAAALAQVLDARAAELQKLDDARAAFLAHTAGTRAAAERAQSMLAERHADDADPEQVITAEEWLAAHRHATAEDEQHRAVAEADVIDDDDIAHTDDERAGQPDRDIREIAAAQPRPIAEDVVRVPSADETSATIQKSNRALAEIHARDVADAREADEHRAEALNRWHAQDQAAEQEATETAVDDEPAFERSDAP